VWIKISTGKKSSFRRDAETNAPVRLASLAANELQALAGERQKT